MALRARLSPPPPPPASVWPYHRAKTGSIAASVLFKGDKRLEAETYLSSGYGIRMAIQSKVAGWRRLEAYARSWQPSRLKGIQVSRDFGTPFLAATQVFDVRPVSRKWLALARTSDASNRFVSPATILVTCSGSVGRPTLAYDAHKDTLISHDLLRVAPREEQHHGWLYAYLLAEQTRAMAKGAHYGHIIKHLETSHLDDLPVPEVSDETAKTFNHRVHRILELRNEGYRLTLEAEELFSKALGLPTIKDWGEQGFSVKASGTLFPVRRRFDAAFHNPAARAIRQHLAKNGQGFTAISDAGYDVWLPNRFRRIPAQDGVLLVESADLTEVNPDFNKIIADSDFGDPHRGRVETGFILMARSGQVYGLLGTAVLAQKDLEDKVITDDVIRIKRRPNAKLHPGYLVTALSHPLLGRPLVKALAYGSSIPHIDPGDLMAHCIVRLQSGDETDIAERAEASARAKAEADILEREIASDAERIIAKFMTAK